MVGLRANILQSFHDCFLNFALKIYALKSKLFLHMVPVADCQTSCVSAINSSFPGRLLADAVNSSPFSYSLTLPSWITAYAGAHVSRGRAQLQKGSPLETQASCLCGAGSPGQSSPVTRFPPFFFVFVWQESPLAPMQNSRLWLLGEKEREAAIPENVVICHHISILLVSKCVFGKSAVLSAVWLITFVVLRASGLVYQT